MKVVELIQSAVRDGIIPDREPSLLDSPWRLWDIESPVGVDQCNPFHVGCDCPPPPRQNKRFGGPVVCLDMYFLRHADYGRLAAWVGQCWGCSKVYCALASVRTEEMAAAPIVKL